MRLDRDILDGLDRAGFKRDMGIDGTGIVLLAWQRYEATVTYPKHFMRLLTSYAELAVTILVC